MITLNPRFPQIKIQHNPKSTHRSGRLATSQPKFEWGQAVVKAVFKLQGLDDVALEYFNFNTPPVTMKYWINAAFRELSQTTQTKYRLVYKNRGVRHHGTLFVRAVETGKGK